jgi:hypothetical protein
MAVAKLGKKQTQPGTTPDIIFWKGVNRMAEGEKKHPRRRHQMELGMQNRPRSPFLGCHQNGIRIGKPDASI